MRGKTPHAPLTNMDPSLLFVEQLEFVFCLHDVFRASAYVQSSALSLPVSVHELVDPVGWKSWLVEQWFNDLVRDVGEGQRLFRLRCPSPCNALKRVGVPEPKLCEDISQHLKSDVPNKVLRSVKKQQMETSMSMRESKSNYWKTTEEMEGLTQPMKWGGGVGKLLERLQKLHT